jgi:hypothetical protein
VVRIAKDIRTNKTPVAVKHYAPRLEVFK